MRTEYTRKHQEKVQRSKRKYIVITRRCPSVTSHTDIAAKLLASKLTPSGSNYLSKFVDFLLIYLLYLLQSADGT